MEVTWPHYKLPALQFSLPSQARPAQARMHHESAQATLKHCMHCESWCCYCFDHPHVHCRPCHQQHAQYLQPCVPDTLVDPHLQGMLVCGGAKRQRVGLVQSPANPKPHCLARNRVPAGATAGRGPVCRVPAGPKHCEATQPGQSTHTCLCSRLHIHQLCALQAQASYLERLVQISADDLFKN